MDGLGEAESIGLEVEAQTRCRDDVDGHGLEVESPMATQTVESLAHEGG